MTNLKKLVFLLSLIIGPALLFAATGDGLWMVKVPDKARNRLNPFAGEATAVAAGAKLYRQNCARPRRANWNGC
jgi:hypothetical protein